VPLEVLATTPLAHRGPTRREDGSRVAAVAVVGGDADNVVETPAFAVQPEPVSYADILASTMPPGRHERPICKAIKVK